VIQTSYDETIRHEFLKAIDDKIRRRCLYLFSLSQSFCIAIDQHSCIYQEINCKMKFQIYLIPTERSRKFVIVQLVKMKLNQSLKTKIVWLARSLVLICLCELYLQLTRSRCNFHHRHRFQIFISLTQRPILDFPSRAELTQLSNLYRSMFLNLTCMV